jgi:hypothetical protein
MELCTRTTRASWRNSDDPHRHSPDPLSNVLKEELTQPYKKFRATGGMSNHQARDAENAKIFKDTYSVCIIGSSYHDLTCGYRIQSKYPGASCGVNCKGKKVKKEDPFTTRYPITTGKPITTRRSVMARRTSSARTSFSVSHSYAETASLRMCISGCSSKASHCPMKTE